MPLIAYIELTIPCLSTCSEGKERSYVLFINKQTILRQSYEIRQLELTFFVSS